MSNMDEILALGHNAAIGYYENLVCLSLKTANTSAKPCHAGVTKCKQTGLVYLQLWLVCLVFGQDTPDAIQWVPYFVEHMDDSTQLGIRFFFCSGSHFF